MKLVFGFWHQIKLENALQTVVLLGSVLAPVPLLPKEVPGDTKSSIKLKKQRTN